MLHEALVDDAAARWIIKSTCSLIFQEEALVDSLVHYDKSDLWSLGILWIELTNCFFELRDFYPDHCVSLSVAHSITEDDEVGRH